MKRKSGDLYHMMGSSDRSTTIGRFVTSKLIFRSKELRAMMADDCLLEGCAR